MKQKTILSLAVALLLIAALLGMHFTADHPVADPLHFKDR